MLKDRTESFKRMRAEQISFYNAKPFYGRPQAEQIYNALKKERNVIQVSVCGAIVAIVSFAKDADAMASVLSKMFPNSTVRQTKCELTGYVSTSVIATIS